MTTQPINQQRKTWKDHVQNPRRLKAMAVREKVESSIRQYFLSEGFREVQTPVAVPSPGMEPHIRPFGVYPHAMRHNLVGSEDSYLSNAYLQTSPEFAMKKLLTGGLPKIFQMAPVFRDEPRSSTHEPEFTMLEWYRAQEGAQPVGYKTIMDDCEKLFQTIAQNVGQQTAEQKIDFSKPWPRLSVRELFKEHLDLDLAHTARADLAAKCSHLGHSVEQRDDWDDLYFKLWLNHVEPQLPQNQPCIVKDYPRSQAALSELKTDADGSVWAKRFEVYCNGLELGNAFEELTDAQEQRQRFERDMELREQVYGLEFPKSPTDESFLQALEEGMPPAGGIAIGVDRLVMLFANEPEIQYTRWL